MKEFFSLSVLHKINDLFKERRLIFADKDAIRSKISDLNNITEESVLVTNNKAVSELDK